MQEKVFCLNFGQAIIYFQAKQSEVYTFSTIDIYPGLSSLNYNKIYLLGKLLGKWFCYLFFFLNENIQLFQDRFLKLDKMSNHVEGF